MIRTMDGNQAAAYIAYAFTEIAAIYPITPSSSMGELMEIWSSENKKNIFGTVPKVIEMQSEAGAAGVIHGSLQTGALSTSFTASQGLLLKLPNMYKISGELLPGVLHVAARSISTHALSIFGDHQDIYSARTTGWAMLSSSTPQESMDMAAVAHLSAISGRLPFLHFFDGFRTSHEITKVEEISYDNLKKLLDYEALTEFRNNSLNSNKPVTRGSSQTEDIYFQVREVQNIFYNKLPDIVNSYMQRINEIRNTDYKPFVYYGHKEATYIIIAMGSVTETIKEVVDYYNKKGEKFGVITVHLYRPFSKKYFLDILPKTVKKIAVLDKTKESGSEYEPLALDIKSVLYDYKEKIEIVAGRYGLSSKDTTPSQILSVFNNLKLKEPKDKFTIGIEDDVTFTSLPKLENIDTGNEDKIECVFYGVGSDGTVGANKNTIKIIGDNTDYNVQAYFLYDSNKARSTTRSYLRFSKDRIRSEYLIQNPKYVAVSMQIYLEKYDILENMAKDSILVVNTMLNSEKIVDRLTNRQKRTLARKNIKMYVINATKLSYQIGLPNRTNIIMQSAFFKLINLIDFDLAKDLMKESIAKTYHKKGEDVILKNYKAVDIGYEHLEEVKIEKEWANFEDEINEYVFKPTTTELEKYIQTIAKPIEGLKGNDIKVSAFLGREDGTLENGSTNYEKRKIATEVPRWIPEHCIQCNQCAYVCPHATIRPFLIDEKEMELSPVELETLKAQGRGMENLRFRIQVSPLDCTGCTACVDICPVKNKALVMVPIEEELKEKEDIKADYLYNKVSYKTENVNKFSVKGSQFAKPLFEFSGACAGCGETTYIKLITQLYGDRMIISNATGCSSIYGASAPSTPYTTNEFGEGPAWASSLFEDNAEFGYGMYHATEMLREKVLKDIRKGLELEIFNENLSKLFKDFLEEENIDNKQKIKREIIKELDNLDISKENKIVKEVYELRNYIVEQSIWIVGGDGWAYDIGYGGLDHVLSTGDNVNILVLDTEVYSNTGGQTSKATPIGAFAKFSNHGKRQKKKDLASILMAYENIYIAKINMGANQNQTLRAIKEAAEFKGPSIIIAYAPCIEHGIKGGLQAQESGKLATEVGYFPLLRYNPDLIKKNKNPLQLDSRNPDFDRYFDFLMSENRFASLLKEDEEMGLKLFEENKKSAMDTWNQYKRLASMDYSINYCKNENEEE